MDGPGNHYTNQNKQTQKDKYHILMCVCERVFMWGVYGEGVCVCRSKTKKGSRQKEKREKRLWGC